VADPVAGPRPVRLTRRGRLLLHSVVIAVVAFTFAGVAASSKASPGVWVTPGERSVVVHDGDTLWSIASRHVPGGHQRAAVEAIRQLNGLQGTRIQVGQELVLPSR
jgi:Tfp pilus assembly protein FimV